MSLIGRFVFALFMLIALPAGWSAPAAAQETSGEFKEALSAIHAEMNALTLEIEYFSVYKRYCKPPMGPSKAEAQAELDELGRRVEALNRRYNELKDRLKKFAQYARVGGELLLNDRDPTDERWWLPYEAARRRMTNALARKRTALAAAPEVDCRPRVQLPPEPIGTVGKPPEPPQPPKQPPPPPPQPPTYEPVKMPVLPKFFCTGEEKLAFLQSISAESSKANDNAGKAGQHKVDIAFMIFQLEQAGEPVPPGLRAEEQRADAEARAHQAVFDALHRLHQEASKIPVIDCSQPTQQEPPRAAPPPPPKPKPEDLRTPIPPRPVGDPSTETGLNPEDIRKMKGQQSLIAEIEAGIAELDQLRLAGRCNDLIKAEDDLRRQITSAGLVVFDNADGTRTKLVPAATLDELRRRAYAATRPCPPAGEPRQDMRTGQTPAVTRPAAPGLSPGDLQSIASQQFTIERFEWALAELESLVRQRRCAAAWDLVEELDDWLDDLEGWGGSGRMPQRPLVPARLIREWDDRIEDILDNCPRPGRPQIRLDVSTILDLHNAERAIYGYQPLRLSLRLSDSAQGAADHLASTGQRVHSSREGRGVVRENLSQGMLGWNTRQMIASWFDEKRYFRAGVFPDVSTTGDWAKVGHYTQGIWPTTTSIGCGLASGSGFKWLVCHYAPGGNKDGHSVGLPQSPSPRHVVSEPRLPMPQPRGEVVGGDIAPPNSSTTVRPPRLPVGGGMTQIDPPAPPPPPPPTARDDAPEGDEARHPLNGYFNEASARHAAAVDCGDRAAQDAEMAKMRYALDELKKRLKDARRAKKLGISAVNPADVQKQIDEMERKLREAEQRRPAGQCPPPAPQQRGVVSQ